MSSDDERAQLRDQLARMSRRRDRERAARQEAEQLLEERSRALWEANQALLHARDSLEDTVQRRTEALRESNIRLEQAMVEVLRAGRAREAFLATMSHEIRTPMNGVIGLARLLAQSPLNPDQVELIEPLLRSADSLMRILDDVLDWSAIAAGHLTLSPHPHAPAELARDVVGLYQGAAVQAGTALQAQVADDVPAWVSGDSGRVRQVLRNLVGNAIKFAPGATVVLRLRTAGAWLVWEIEDTGVGMSPDQLERVFQAFTQADGEVRSTYGGTGLGLTISRELAQRMGGELSCTSALGQGTTFELRLPLERAEAPTATEEEDTTLPQPAHVLVVDDNPVNRLVACRHLESIGCTVDTVDEGRSALLALADQRYDLVFMDLHMPGMDGLTATRLVRSGAAGPACQAVPVIGLTADVMEQQRAECHAAGMTDFVCKPFRTADLAAAVRRALAATADAPPRPVSAAG